MATGPDRPLYRAVARLRSSLGARPWAVRYSMEARVVGSMRMRVQRPCAGLG